MAEPLSIAAASSGIADGAQPAAPDCPPGGAARRGRGRPAGSGLMDRRPELAQAAAALLSAGRYSAPRLLELLAARHAPPLPSLRSLQAFVAHWEAFNAALALSVRDPDGAKSRHRLALGRAGGDLTHAHQLWEIDTTTADVMTLGGRRMILGVIDVWSRRARFRVVPSESGQAVRRFLVDTILAWNALPEALRTDNGSGYVNRSVASALPMLGIEHQRCAPGQPEGKPHVERLFGTLTRERLALLPGFTGHSVADAQKLRARAKKLTGRAQIAAAIDEAALQAALDHWVDGVYHQRRHAGLGMSPMARWTSSPVPAREPPSRDILARALSALVGARTVGKRGIEWKGGRYWASELAGLMGQTVEVRRDEDDMGALMVFDAAGRFVCTAVNHMRAGVGEAEFAQAARAQQAAWLAEARAQARGLQRAFNPDAYVEARLRADAEAAGKLAVLPRPTRPAPALDHLVAPPPPAPPAVSPRARAALDGALGEAAAAPLSMMTTAQKVTWADAILARIAAGQPVTQDDGRAATAFAASSAYRAHKALDRATAQATKDHRG